MKFTERSNEKKNCGKQARNLLMRGSRSMELSLSCQLGTRSGDKPLKTAVLSCFSLKWETIK